MKINTSDPVLMNKQRVVWVRDYYTVKQSITTVFFFTNYHTITVGMNENPTEMRKDVRIITTPPVSGNFSHSRKE